MAFLCHVCVSGIPLLHTGHTLFDLSHGSIHSVWSLCEHGRVLTSSPFFIGSRQTMHSYSVKSSFHQGSNDGLVLSDISQRPNVDESAVSGSLTLKLLKESYQFALVKNQLQHLVNSNTFLNIFIYCLIIYRIQYINIISYNIIDFDETDRNFLRHHHHRRH